VHVNDVGTCVRVVVVDVRSLQCGTYYVRYGATFVPALRRLHVAFSCVDGVRVCNLKWPVDCARLCKRPPHRQLASVLYYMHTYGIDTEYSSLDRACGASSR